MQISRIKGWFLLSAGMLMLLAGCGNDTTNTEYVQTSAPASTYLVEYIPGTTMGGMMADATTGKTTFQLRVRNRSTFAAASGLTIQLIPTMYMASHSHGTPVDVVKESSTPGTYDCTIYYLMASGTGMMGGYWSLDAKIGSETAMFYPSVGMAMGPDTVRATLKGQSNDLISSMTGTSFRTYYLFKDGNATTTSINLFLASDGNMSQTYPTIYSGATLTNYQNVAWTVSTVLVEATTDTLSSWQTGTDSAGHGHWLVSGLTLTSAQTNTVYVRVTVNGSVKTTDGLMASGPNGYATLTVVP
ncbi:MAG: hypothetical protein HGB21_06265 [Nitrospirae bacterium]|nr:hypothetical protein [Nitrospirota bacterium]